MGKQQQAVAGVEDHGGDEKATAGEKTPAARAEDKHELRVLKKEPML